MPNSRIVQASTLLSRILRHDPGCAGLTLDVAGWVTVDELLAALGAQGRPLSRAELDQVVAENDKRRFAYSEDGRSIRASQGHTIAVDLGLPAAEPPAALFHGTAEHTLQPILSEGLRPMARQDVHLSADIDTAIRVGSRHGRPVVLQVDAAALSAAGHEFRLSANDVWLSGPVPPRHLHRIR
ncbi:RNA 2'-phosphotransferase [Kitasatospora sp. NPDC059088]|uniref:RNA 2'-phosphotransferase n=1 Tax=Kitasatospora sp. NPDC059088 TaxID=3346722 RepID=UPI0036A41900